MDDGGTANGGVDTSAAQTFTIAVAGVNDPPTFTAGPDQTVAEDAGAQTVILGHRDLAWSAERSRPDGCLQYHRQYQSPPCSVPDQPCHRPAY